MAQKRYLVKRADRSSDENLRPGDVVYSIAGYDWGIASEDSRSSGIDHTSVTYSPEGKHPFFTIPKDDIQLIEDTNAPAQ